MYKTVKTSIFLSALCCGTWVASPGQTMAQAVVTTYAPAAPVVSYVPERRGLFGRRIVYRPVVTPAVVPVTTVAPVAPAVPVTVSRPVVVTMSPVVAADTVTAWRLVTPAPAVTAWRPVTTTAPVTVARPVVVSQPVTTTYYAPAEAAATYVAPATACCQ